MMGLLAPLGLAALAALAVPLVIHLIRRTELRTIRFAALRYIGDRARPRKSLRLHEWLLLVLRMLLLTVLALLLAIPVWRAKAQAPTAWTGVAPDVDLGAAYPAPGRPDASWHWLAPGFPALADSPAPAGDSPATIQSLIREIDAELPAETTLTLVVPAELHGLDAERLRLRHAVEWRIVPASTNLSPPPPAPARTLRIAVRHDADAAPELALVRALVAAWRVDGLDPQLDIGPLDAPPAADADWLFWFGGKMPAGINDWVWRGGIVLISRQPQAEGEPLLFSDGSGVLLTRSVHGRGAELDLTSALRTDAQPDFLDPGFPARLLRVLRTAGPPPDQALAETFAPGRIEAAAPSGPVRRFDRELAAVAALLLAMERIWATRRRTTAKRA